MTDQHPDGEQPRSEPSRRQGPPPAVPQGAYGPPGPYGPTYAAQPLPTGLPSWAKVVLGGLIGLVASVASPLLAFVLAGLEAPTELLVLLVTIIPPLLASPLLIARSTRMWGVGVMLGLALGSLVLGGACVSLISGS